MTQKPTESPTPPTRATKPVFKTPKPVCHIGILGHVSPPSPALALLLAHLKANYPTVR